MPPKRKMKSNESKDDENKDLKRVIEENKKEIKLLKSEAVKAKRKHTNEVKSLKNEAIRVQMRHDQAIKEIEKSVEVKTEEVNYFSNQATCDKKEVNDLKVKLEVSNKKEDNYKKEIIDLKVKLKDSNKNKKIVDTLLEKLECPVCLTIPRFGPTPICPNGHIVCSKCIKDLRICPMCRVNMGHAKSLLAKAVIENIDHKCDFAGCAEQLSHEKLNAHAKVCSHRPVLCPYVTCHVKVGLSKLVYHMQVNHNSKHKMIPSDHSHKFEMHFRSNNPNESVQWKPRTFSYNNVCFCILVEKEKGHHYTYPVIFASSSDCSKYIIELAVHERSSTLENSKYCFKLCGQPISIDEDKKELKSLGLAVNRRGMEQVFRNSNNKTHNCFSCTISIRNIS